jgi:hypothetical protein
VAHDVGIAAAVAVAPAIHVATFVGQAAHWLVDVLKTYPGHVPIYGQEAEIVVHGTQNEPANAPVGTPTAFGVNPVEHAAQTIADNVFPVPVI